MACLSKILESIERSRLEFQVITLNYHVFREQLCDSLLCKVIFCMVVLVDEGGDLMTTEL